MCETPNRNWSKEVRVEEELEIGPPVDCYQDIDFSKPFTSTIIFEDDFDSDERGTSPSELLADEDCEKILSVNTFCGDGTGTQGSEDVKTFIIHEVEPIEEPLTVIANSYEWNKVLFRCDFLAAPVKLFKHAPLHDIFENTFEGIKVEIKNTDCESTDQNKSSDYFWIATIIKVKGYMGLFRYQGFGNNTSRDFWVNLCCPEARPVGWCATRGKPLKPPKSIQDKYSDWNKYLVKRLSGARTLPANFYTKFADSLKSRFSVGMLMEVVDKNRIFQVKVASIHEIIGKRLHIKYYDSSLEDNGFWCHEDSPLIHPVGWAFRVGHRLDAPPSYWQRVARGRLNPNDTTPDMFYKYPTMEPPLFTEGMKLEAIDPLNLSAICAATVMQILNDGYMMIRIDCYPPPDVSGVDWFCYHQRSPCILPVGFCAANSIRIMPPVGWTTKEFNWSQYLAGERCRAAPATSFAPRTHVVHGFEAGMRLECAHLMDPSDGWLICAATVTRVVADLLKVHFDGCGDEYEQWLWAHSTDMYPVGWCRAVGHRLEGPQLPAPRIAPHPPRIAPRLPRILPRPPRGASPPRRLKGGKPTRQNTEHNIPSFEAGASAAAAEDESIGPVFMKEPPNRVDFSNTTGAVVECAARGFPGPVIWVCGDGAAVGDVPGLRQVHFDGCGYEHGQWLRAHSTDMYPVGWCRAVGHRVEVPPPPTPRVAPRLPRIAPRPPRIAPRPPRATSPPRRLELKKGSPQPTINQSMTTEESSQNSDMADMKSVSPLTSASETSADVEPRAEDTTEMDVDAAPEERVEAAAMPPPPVACSEQHHEMVVENEESEHTMAQKMVTDHRKSKVLDQPEEHTSPPPEKVTDKYVPRLVNNATVYRDMMSEVDPENWSEADVARFLTVNDCQTYCINFANITGKKLLELSRDEIIELLEMKVGPSLKVFDLIMRLKCKIKTPQNRLLGSYK